MKGQEGLLTITEVMQLLQMGRAEVNKLVHDGQLNAFKVGGSYLRFKRSQVLDVKRRNAAEKTIQDIKGQSNIMEDVRDFLATNNFYFVSAACLALLLYFTLR